MPPLTSKQLAILTARVGAARSGAVRAGYVPADTVGTSPGSAGPYVPDKKVVFPSATWTRVL